MKAAIIGGGVIGAGWAARFLLNGWDVALFDPDPDAPRKLDAVLQNARASLPALSDLPMPAEGRLHFADTLAQAVTGSDYIQESVSERLALKHDVYAGIQHIAPDTPLGSSTSGYKPSQLQEGATNPSTIFVAHPFNPVYLLPLVEIVPGPASDAAMIDRVKAMLQALGMFPLHLRKEIDAHIADRFLEAVWREALWLVRDGIATTEEIDEAIRMGFGLRWGQMGLFETFRIAGGEAGMTHFLAQFGPCLSLPWTRLTDVPPYDDELVALIAGQSDAQSGHYTIRELERIRDDNLVGFLRALKERDWGAGRVLNAHDAGRVSTAGSAVAPLRLTQMRVLPGWIDRDARMSESRIAAAAHEVADKLLRLIAADSTGGQGYCTTESHVTLLGAARLGDHLTGSVQLLAADAQRLHIAITIAHNEMPIACIEQRLLHIDTHSGQPCPIPPELLARLMTLRDAHAHLPQPAGAGRHAEERKG